MGFETLGEQGPGDARPQVSLLQAEDGGVIIMSQNLSFRYRYPQDNRCGLDERDEASTTVEDPVREIAPPRGLPRPEGRIRPARRGPAQSGKELQGVPPDWRGAAGGGRGARPEPRVDRQMSCLSRTHSLGPDEPCSYEGARRHLGARIVRARRLSQERTVALMTAKDAVYLVGGRLGPLLNAS